MHWMCTSCGSLGCLHDSGGVQMDEWLLCMHTARALLCSDLLQREIEIKRINQCNSEFDMTTTNSVLNSIHNTNS
ncbi:unnamed protein product [Brugia pahangi]|uniref:Secreted protein n=1 Tax=Brugia pahangi TaxID=6280 RepID=A0A0N4T0Q0_BRUPA|nr:unnamed protein product [Brugia pahangi]